MKYLSHHSSILGGISGIRCLWTANTFKPHAAAEFTEDWTTYLNYEEHFVF